MLHITKPCSFCRGTLFRVKRYATEYHNIVYEERCSHCKNLVYAEIKPEVV